MEPVKVPQHLELEDVLVWNLTAADLVWLAAGLVSGWWLFLHLPVASPLRIGVAAAEALLGALLGPARLADRPLRHWVREFAAYAARPRQRVYGGPA